MVTLSTLPTYSRENKTVCIPGDDFWPHKKTCTPLHIILLDKIFFLLFFLIKRCKIFFKVFSSSNLDCVQPSLFDNVEIFWEGHKILKKISHFFEVSKWYKYFFSNFVAFSKYLNFRNIYARFLSKVRNFVKFSHCAECTIVCDENILIRAILGQFWTIIYTQFTKFDLDYFKKNKGGVCLAGRIFGQIMDIEQSKDLRIFLNLFPQISNIFKSKLSKKHLVQPICIN